MGGQDKLPSSPSVRVSSLCKSFLLQVEGGLGEVGGAAEVAPVVVVGAEGEDGVALGGEAEVGGDDGEDAFFGEQGEEAGRDYVDGKRAKERFLRVSLSKPLCVDEFAAFEPGQGFDGFPGFLLGEPQVIEILQIEPKLGAGAKEMSEAQGRVAGNRARPVQDLRDAIGGHADLSRQFRRAHFERFQFLGQVFTRMNYSDCHSGSPSDSQQSPRAMVPATRPATRSKSAIDR
jgi:hypothetical protein